VQLLNATLPIEVTLLGIVILFSEVQLENAKLLIEVTLFGIVYSVNPADANEFNTPSIIKQRLAADANLP
jgi:hypothetical protein